MKNMDAVRLVVRHHHEKLDGSGLPRRARRPDHSLTRVVRALAVLKPDLDTALPDRSTAGAVRERERINLRTKLLVPVIGAIGLTPLMRATQLGRVRGAAAEAIVSGTPA
jgi:hypothetical protein